VCIHCAEANNDIPLSFPVPLIQSLEDLGMKGERKYTMDGNVIPLVTSVTCLCRHMKMVGEQTEKLPLLWLRVQKVSPLIYSPTYVVLGTIEVSSGQNEMDL